MTGNASVCRMIVEWTQQTASFPSGILPQIAVHINEPPTQIKYFWINYLLTVWMEGFNLFASILLPASLHHACFLLPSFLSLPPLFHISPLPAPLQPSVSLRKRLFFSPPRTEREGLAGEARPPAATQASRLLSHSLQLLFLELKIFFGR